MELFADPFRFAVHTAAVRSFSESLGRMASANVFRRAWTAQRIVLSASLMTAVLIQSLAIPLPAISDTGSHAFLWQDGVMTDLGTISGNRSEGLGINNQGQIVGDSTTQASLHPILWQHSVMSDLAASMTPASLGIAYDINNIGQVIGDISFTSGPHAFLWSLGEFTDIGTFGGTGSGALGINDHSQVVGYAYFPDGSTVHAFLYDRLHDLQDLGTLGGRVSEAWSINNSGQVVGESWISNTTSLSHAFLWENGTMHDLGSFGGISALAYDINDSGDIVGRTVMADGTMRAVLYKNEVPIDLTTVLSPESGWSLREAIAINSRGQIVGNGYYQGQLLGYLLTPTGQGYTLTNLQTLPGGSYSSAVDINDRGDITGTSGFTGPVSGVPEPTSALLFGSGLLFFRKRLSNGLIN